MARRERARFEFGIVDKVVAIGEVVVLVILVVLNILASKGLSLVHGEIYSFLAMVIPMALLGWGVYRILRRIEKRRTRLIVGCVLAMVVMIVFTLMMSYVSVLASMTVPQPYTTLRSPSGKRTLMLMRAMDLDESHIEERRAARLAANPEADPETQREDYGYQYLAFPPVLRFFYRNDVDIEGVAYMGITSAAELKLEWLEDESAAHFFVSNPGPGDGGEFTVRFNDAK